jgi:hypothetical protein
MSRHNPWKGFVLGMLGGLGGLTMMNLYRDRLGPRIKEMTGNRLEDWGEGEMVQRYQDVSIYGQQSEEGQRASEVLGRRIYKGLTGSDPRSKEGMEILTNLTHIGSRMLQGGMYGAMQKKSRLLDIRSGMLFGTAVWMYGDEVIMPLLGLHQGPTQIAPKEHINRLAEHWAFGIGTALTTQFLRKFF